MELGLLTAGRSPSAAPWPAGHCQPLLGRHVGGQRSLELPWAASLWDARLSWVWGPVRRPDVHVSFAPRSKSIQGWWKRSAQHLLAAPPSQKAGRRVVQAQRVTRPTWMLPRPRPHLPAGCYLPFDRRVPPPARTREVGQEGRCTDPAQTLWPPAPAGPGLPQARWNPSGREGPRVGSPLTVPSLSIASVSPALSARHQGEMELHAWEMLPKHAQAPRGREGLRGIRLICPVPNKLGGASAAPAVAGSGASGWFLGTVFTDT